MSNCLLIRNARVLTPLRLIEHGAVLISGDTITAVGPESELDRPADAETLDADGQYVAPGFIETHVHGGGGGDIIDGTVEGILQCARLHARGGVTAFLATTLTAPMAQIQRAIETCAEAQSLGHDGAAIVGMHLEGPYLNARQTGAQNPAYLKRPEPEEYLALLDKYPSIVRVTVAPELPGALELGQELRRRGRVASIGHTDATYQQIVRAVENGYTHATHMFSGMSAFHRENAYRIAGTIEAVLTLDELTTELIGDGHHVPPSMMKMVLKAKGLDRVCLTTDAMAAAGLGPGRYTLMGLDVIVEDQVAPEFEIPGCPGHHVAKLTDRTAFASSVATMDQIVRTMVTYVGLSLADAVKMATLVPARIHHLDRERGMLAPGMKADAVIFDQQVRVLATVVEGRVVYRGARGEGRRAKGEG